MASTNLVAPTAWPTVNGTHNGDSSKDDNETVQGPTAEQHVAVHLWTMEDVPDESELQHPEQPTTASILLEKVENGLRNAWSPAMPIETAVKPAEKVEKPKENKIQTKDLDTQSHDLFPELAGPKPKQMTNAVPIWGSKKTAPTAPAVVNGSTDGVSTNGTSRASTPATRVVPPSLSTHLPPMLGPQAMALPGRHTERISLEPSQMLSRAQMRKPLPDIVKDINKKSKAIITTNTGDRGLLWLSATGPEMPCRQALQDLVAQIGSKQSVKILVPRSTRAHIIGKAGSKIKELQEKTGARIQVQKAEDTPSTVDDDNDVMVPVLIEGNAITAESARTEVLKIANERAATVNTKLRGIPAEFYPFIAGPHNALANALEEANGLQIRVPPHHMWTVQPPPEMPPKGQFPLFQPATGDHHISLAGERAAVQAARAEIERRVEQLRKELILDQFPLNRGRHQFIIGDRGISPQQFFADTGCAIILPGNADEDTITIVGPSNRIPAATDRAIELASEMQSNSFDIARLHRNAPDGAGKHALNVTRYLRHRREIERLEDLHKTHIVTPITHEGTAAPWELYSRDGKNAIRAQSEIDAIVRGHPPARMACVPVDPFFHTHFETQVLPRIRQDYGVHVVLPTPLEEGLPTLLVYEGPSSAQSEYQVSRGQPLAEEIESFQKSLEDARKQIVDIMQGQAELASESLDVPRMFHEKLRRHIQQEQRARPDSEIPVRVSSNGSIVTFRGPAPSVVRLTSNANVFLSQAIADEKERDFTTSFEFPQKYANQLIGRGGSNVRELRDKFDVDIQVTDGKVELKGPPTKCTLAKTHISALARKWADEAAYTLKIEPRYHRELIGAQGVQINKLQNRYKVQIHFPKTARSPRDDQSAADGSSETGRRSRREQEADEVIVKGPKKGADDARDEILSLLQYLKDNSFTATVTVQQSQIPSLMGSRGRDMDELRLSTGAKIDVPNSRDSQDPSGRVEIQIKGSKSQVGQAKKLLEEKKTIFDSSISKTLEVDKKHHRALIGPQGSILRDMVVKAGGSDDRRDLARTVQFPKAESDGSCIRIEGKKDVVEKIIAAMQEIIRTRDKQCTESFDIPTEKHRSLIGRGGEIKKKIESRFQVSLDIPRPGNGSAIKVTGLPEDVSKAKAYIAELVREQAGETINVPRNLHHVVADHGQIFRRLRNDYRISIDHAGEQPPPKSVMSPNTRTNSSALPLITDDASSTTSSFDWCKVDISSDIAGTIPWTLRGSPDDILKARTVIEAAIAQATTRNTIGYLRLPDPKSNKFVIGPGGKIINGIRSATKCKVTVPKSGESEAIEIIGSEETIEKAKKMILDAVREGLAGRNGERH